MKLSHKLFELISSLSKGEKLYFKKFAARHIRKGKNNYIKLFDVINAQVKQGRYNEEAVRNSFRGEKLTNNFAEAKTYLYDSILKSLSSARNEEITTLINNTIILSSKNLYRQAWICLQKAKKKAVKHENIYLMPKILNIEYYHILQFNTGKQLEMKLNKHHREEKAVMEKITNLNKIKNLSGKIVSFRSQHGWVRGKKEMKELEAIINDEIFKSPDMALSSMAKFLYFQAKATYSYYKLDFTNAYVHLQNQLELMESALPEKDPINYSMVLQNFLYVSINLKKFDNIERYLNVFENFMKDTKLTSRSRTRLLTSYYIIKLYLLYLSPDLDKSSKTLHEIEGWLEENFDPVANNSVYYLSLDISSLYIFLEDYQKALHWINKILNDRNTENQMEVIIPARILSMIIHYELNNLTYLEHSVKSTYRFLLKKNKVYKFEKILLKFIRNLTGIGASRSFMLLLEDFKHELEVIRNDAFERQAFEYFDYITWIESKIRKRSMPEIHREKLKAAKAV